MAGQQDELRKWEVGELLAQWWRPNFEGQSAPLTWGEVKRGGASGADHAAEMGARRVHVPLHPRVRRDISLV